MDLDDEELIVTKNKCKYYKDIEQTLIRRVIGDLYAIRNKLHSEAIEKGYDGAYLNKSIDLAIDIINAASVESAEKDKIIAEKSAEIEKLEKESKQYFETTIKQAKQFDKEIENYKNLIADVSIIAQELGLEEDGTTDEIIAQIGRFKNNINILDQECSRLEKKEAKQDKMIDLLIDYIDKLTDDYTGLTGENNIFCDEKCIDKNIDCYDCIKQYFEQKATNDV